MKKNKTKEKKTVAKMPTWDLSHLYSSPDDPRMERDMVALEKRISDFVSKYDVPDKKYLNDPVELKRALAIFEDIIGESQPAPFLYFYFLRDIKADDKIAPAKLALLETRMAKVQSAINFFEKTVGSIPVERQKKLLKDPSLAHFKVLLERIFNDTRYMLSIPEEKILNLKALTSYSMWVSANERILNMKSVQWKGKTLPLPQALQLVPNLMKVQERQKLAAAIADVLKSVAPFSEAEINAVFTDKKINDELRGFAKPFEDTVRIYRNNPKVVEKLVDVVTEYNRISHAFYRLKAKLLKQKHLSYCDRAAKIGVIKTKFSFSESVDILKDVFGKIDPKYSKILEVYIAEGRIDALPRVGKRSGAYCAGSYAHPTYVLLNHTDDLHSYTVAAHEMGHAFHGELSRSQGPIYSNYSTALAETASTLFESIAREAIVDRLPDHEKIILLHDQINEHIATIFRQIACFKFELELHSVIRTKGFVSKEEIVDIHNKNMKAYLGSVFDLKRDDGYFFVQWMHIRNFFYVYTYAYGLLVSKALLRRYRKDKSFWKKIEQFLSAGGKDSPENILKEIGIDVSKPDFWKEGLKEIEDDIARLEKLTMKK